MTGDGTGGPLPELSKFRIITHLGGMHFRARRLDRQDIVAVKVVEAGRRGVSREHLHDCVSRARELDHPNVIRTLDMVEDSGKLVVVADYVEGETLGRALQRNVRMQPKSVAAAIGGMAAALSAASERGLVHGALHPNEIILADDGPKLSAVGLDEALPDEFVGTEDSASGRFSPYLYAAPERIGGAPHDELNDVFSLGALAFHMLTGHPPFAATTLSELKLARMEGTLRWPRGAEDSIPVELIFLVEEMCSAGRSARPTSLREVRNRIALLGKAPPRRAPRPARMPKVATETELAPTGDSQRMPPPPRPSLAERRGPIMALASVGFFVLVVALALRSFISARPDGENVPAEGPKVETAEPGRTEGPSRKVTVTAPAPIDTYRKRFKDCESLLAERPANKEPIIKALRELAANTDASPWDIRARMLLDDMARKEGTEGRAQFERILTRSRELEAEMRFAEAAKSWDEFPEALQGTRWHARVIEETARLGRAAPQKYAEIETRAHMYLARGDIESARNEYRRVIDNFGIEKWVAKARSEIGKVGVAEERIAAERAVAAREARAAQLREESARAFASAYALSASFKYEDASKLLKETAPKLKGFPRIASRMKSYAEAIESERRFFAKVAERFERGDAAASGYLSDERVSFDVKGFTAKGVTCIQDDGTGKIESRLEWDRLPDRQSYNLFRLGSNKIDPAERMALAVFCFHRGLKSEEHNELTLASHLDTAMASKVADLRRLLDELRADLRPESGASPLIRRGRATGE